LASNLIGKAPQFVQKYPKKSLELFPASSFCEFFVYYLLEKF